MARPLSIALIAIFCLTFTARAEDKPSPAVKRILDKAVGKVRANRTEFDKANKKPLDEARAELQELAKKLVDDGKAEEATAVLAQVKTLDGDVMRMANAPAPVAGGAIAQRPLLERMEGRWDRTTQQKYVQISKDGSAAHLYKTNNKVDTTGRITVVTPDVAEVRWSNGYRWELRMAGEDAVAIFEWDDSGRRANQGLALERIK